MENEKKTVALKDSIAKWEAIVALQGGDRGADNCALCQLYEGCEGCPIAEKVNGGCQRTPYSAWLRHHSWSHNRHRSDDTNSLSCVEGCNECLALAKKELNFLKSLMPRHGEDPL